MSTPTVSQGRRCRPASAVGIAAIAWVFAAPALGQTITAAGVPGDGHGAVSLTLQLTTITERTVPEAFGGGFEDFGEITLRSAYFEIDYGVTERLALNVSLPYKSNRYRGNVPHDPRTLQDDHGQRFLDDGRYHGNWGDAGIGLRYQLRTEPVAVTPFVALYVPSNNYPLFTETQAGTGQWRLDIGANASGRFSGTLRNVYWQAGYAYSLMEKTSIDDGRVFRVNHGIASLELGWFATPQLTARTTLTWKQTYGGLDFPEDFTPPFIDDLYYHHDQLFKWGGTTLGVGLDYRVGEYYVASLGYGRSLHVSWGHKYDDVITLGLSRGF